MGAPLCLCARASRDQRPTRINSRCKSCTGCAEGERDSQALHEAGLRPTAVTGASAGAVVAGLYGAGYEPDEMEAVFCELDFGTIFSFRPTVYWGFPVVGLFRQNLGALEALLLVDRPMRLEDARLPVALSAYDVDEKQLKVLRTGRLVRRARACVCLSPGGSREDGDQCLFLSLTDARDRRVGFRARTDARHPRRGDGPPPGFSIYPARFPSFSLSLSLSRWWYRAHAWRRWTMTRLGCSCDHHRRSTRASAATILASRAAARRTTYSSSISSSAHSCRARRSTWPARSQSISSACPSSRPPRCA